MLTVQSLRNALKKLQSSDLAKFLIQRATNGGGSEALRDSNTTKPPIFFHSQTYNTPITPSQSTSLSKIDQTITSSSTTSPPPTPPTTIEKSTGTPKTTTTKTSEQLKRITAEIAAVSLNSNTEVESQSTNDSNNRSSNSNITTNHSNQYNINNIILSVSSCDQSNKNMPETEVSKVAVPAALATESTLNKLEKSTNDNTIVEAGDLASSVSCQNGVAKEKACFKSSLADIVEFLELVGSLKHTKRTGWVLRDVPNCESISGHMYRMSMMTFLLDGSEGLNQIRCMELALVHDLAESVVGDLTPFCGVSKEDKKALELKAMEDICKLIEPRGRRIMELFEEYENGESDESKFVKDLDRLDMVLQAFEYEKRDDCVMKHQEFFDSTYGKFNHPFVKKLVNEIYDQRKELAAKKGLPNGKQNGEHCEEAAGTKESTNVDEKTQVSSS